MNYDQRSEWLAVNKRYILIAGFVLTTKHLARNNGSAARQESSPQSATKHSSNVNGNCKGRCETKKFV